MPLAVMKLPMLHCATKGMNRKSASCEYAEKIEIAALEVKQQVANQQQLKDEGRVDENCGPVCQ